MVVVAGSVGAAESDAVGADEGPAVGPTCVADGLSVALVASVGEGVREDAAAVALELGTGTVPG